MTEHKRMTKTKRLTKSKNRKNKKNIKYISKKVMKGGSICDLFNTQAKVNESKPKLVNNKVITSTKQISNYMSEMLELIGKITLNDKEKIIADYKRKNKNSNITNDEILQIHLSELKNKKEFNTLETNIKKTIDSLNRSGIDKTNTKLPLLISDLINFLGYKKDNQLQNIGNITFPQILVDNKAIKIQTSGNENDCLIHSILTCISEDFARLHIENKNIIAYYFRRHILPLIIPTQTVLLKSSNFLDDSIIERINGYYNINIISVVDDDIQREHRSKFVNLYHLNTYNPNCFLIHNRGLMHFSAIYLLGLNTFNVPQNIIKELIRQYSFSDTKQDKDNINRLDHIMKQIGYIVNGEIGDGNRYTNQNTNQRLSVDEAEKLFK